MKIPAKASHTGGHLLAILQPRRRSCAVPNARRKFPDHIAQQPEVLLYNGRTLVQPRMPALLAQYGLAEERSDGHAPPLASDEDLAAEELAVAALDGPDLMFIEHTPPPDPTKHRRKRAAQWQRWQNEVLPKLLPHFAQLLQETKSLREMDSRRPQPSTCACRDPNTHNCGHAVCSGSTNRFQPSKTVTIQISPNNGAFTDELERVLGNMGFQLDHQVYLQVIPSNINSRTSAELSATALCKLSYVVHPLRNLLKDHCSQTIETVREAVVGLDVPIHAAWTSTSPLRSRRRTVASSPGTPTTRRTGATATSSLSSSDTPRPAPQTRKRAREPTPEPGKPKCPKVPFPEPPPRVRPSKYLCRRCPACFANLKRDNSQLRDGLPRRLLYTEEKKKTPPDPPKRHPHTHFVPEEQTQRTEEYVESVRAAKEDGRENDKRRKRATVQEVEDEAEDGYEFERLPLPRSVLDGCEASFKAVDEKQEKASTEFFEDTALMGLLCRHDRVLWVANMHSAGEKQFYVVALIETFFQHVPHDIWVGILYDVACALECSCLKWNFLDRYIDRIAFAVSVFHVFGHEWPCQLLYHPRKRVGFGFTNGEGCERFWKSIQHLITHLRICGYHNRLYILDTQIEHDDEASLFRLGEWISRRYRHSRSKAGGSDGCSALSPGKSKELLHEQWYLQVESQTAAFTLSQLRELRKKFLKAAQEGRFARAPASDGVLRVVRQALHNAERTLQRQEEVLGVEENEELEMLVNNNKLIAHTEAAIKRRSSSRTARRPEARSRPIPIPAEGMWELDVDDTIFQEVGLDGRDDDGEPPLWLCNKKVRTGIKAMLELDQCDEEDAQFAEGESGVADSDVDKYHLKLHQNKLVRLCATWDKCLPNFGAAMGLLPPWGPSVMQLSSCCVDAHRAAHGEERHYGQKLSWDDEDEDGEQSGGEDEDFGILDAVIPPQAVMEAVVRRLEDEPEEADPVDKATASKYEELVAMYEMDYDKRDGVLSGLCPSAKSMQDKAYRYHTPYGYWYTLDNGQEENLAFELRLLAIFTEYVDAGADFGGDSSRDASVSPSPTPTHHMICAGQSWTKSFANAWHPKRKIPESTLRPTLGLPRMHFHAGNKYAVGSERTALVGSSHQFSLVVRSQKWMLQGPFLFELFVQTSWVRAPVGPVRNYCKWAPFHGVQLQ
ncbi:hypothetical protein B0H14DRAFT_2578119 [Mycena olivaceomarginata]|nr:hypothetical protein B0H14DRAFT_2578119 [Mycena olivaceomarginata]